MLIFDVYSLLIESGYYDDLETLPANLLCSTIMPALVPSKMSSFSRQPFLWLFSTISRDCPNMVVNPQRIVKLMTF